MSRNIETKYRYTRCDVWSNDPWVVKMTLLLIQRWKYSDISTGFRSFRTSLSWFCPPRAGPYSPRAVLRKVLCDIAIFGIDAVNRTVWFTHLGGSLNMMESLFVVTNALLNLRLLELSVQNSPPKLIAPVKKKSKTMAALILICWLGHFGPNTCFHLNCQTTFSIWDVKTRLKRMKTKK